MFAAALLVLESQQTISRLSCGLEENLTWGYYGFLDLPTVNTRKKSNPKSSKIEKTLLPRLATPVRNAMLSHVGDGPSCLWCPKKCVKHIFRQDDTKVHPSFFSREEENFVYNLMGNKLL